MGIKELLIVFLLVVIAFRVVWIIAGKTIARQEKEKAEKKLKRQNAKSAVPHS